jgi:hypothetical protein
VRTSNTSDVNFTSSITIWPTRLDKSAPQRR